MVRSLILALFVVPSLARAAPGPMTVASLTRDVLAYLARQQTPVSNDLYMAGEWPSRVYSTAFPALLGIGRLNGDEEPTAFATAAVVNELEMIREARPDLPQIEPMMRKAIPSFERYREGELYNFYPPLIWNGVRVHQPSSMRLSRTWKGITNIPEDADTTSTVYTAKHFTARIEGRSQTLPSAVTRSFERFRDLDRKPHWYDEDLGFADSGAFLTWQFDENDSRMPRSFYAEPDEGTRIPLRRNDVDCVVNMNVLRMLAVHQAGNSAGRKAACRLAAEVVTEEKYAKCGMYYPNTYNFAYSASQADEAGETCLRPYASGMVDFILSHQHSDGGWYNVGNFEINDRVQSTAFALIALERFAHAGDSEVREAVRNGVGFLYSRMRRDAAGGLYWPGETFFTATALARSLVDWRSDSFTTVVALAAILRAEKSFGAAAAPEPSVD